MGRKITNIASLVELVVEGGVQEFCCPITGRPVVERDMGFVLDKPVSSYVRFIVDSTGEFFAVSPDRLPPDQAKYHEKVIRTFEEPGDADQNTLIEKCRKLMPASAVIVEVLDPPVGSYDGTIYYVAFDLQRKLDETPKSLRLEPLGVLSAHKPICRTPTKTAKKTAKKSAKKHS